MPRPNPNRQGVYIGIEGMVEFAKDGIVSKALLRAPDKEVSLFCMTTGQMLSGHTSGYPAIIHVLKGEGEVTLGDKKYIAKVNDWFFMPANLLHALFSTDNLVFLLTLFKKADQAVGAVAQ